MNKVLWIDDQHERGEGYKTRAEGFDIILDGYKDYKTGVNIFKKNPDEFDAVVLDGMFFDDKNDTEEKELWDQTARVIKNIDENIEIVIFTGNKEKIKSSDCPFQIFEKGEDDDELYKRLKEVCEKRPNNKLRRRYPEIFELIKREYLGDKAGDRIISLLHFLDESEKIQNTEDELNAIRKIIEDVIDKFSSLGFIPDDVNHLNTRIKFLQNQHELYGMPNDLIPPMAAFNLMHLNLIVQDGSHSEGNTLRADDYFKNTLNDSLFRGLIYILIDFLSWFKLFIDNNPDIDVNVSKIKHKTDTISEVYVHKVNDDGSVDIEDYNGEHIHRCNKELLKKSGINDNELKKGDSVSLTYYLKPRKPFKYYTIIEKNN